MILTDADHLREALEIAVRERDEARAEAAQLRAELEGQWLKRSAQLEADGAKLLAGLAASSHARLRRVAERQREACAYYMVLEQDYSAQACRRAPLVTEAQP